MRSTSSSFFGLFTLLLLGIGCASSPNAAPPRVLAPNLKHQGPRAAYANAGTKPEPVRGWADVAGDIGYPEIAIRAGVGGRVIVDMIVGADGKPYDVYVKRGIGVGCDEAAVAALRGETFTPGTVGGEAVAVEMQVMLRFLLDQSRVTMAPYTEDQ